MISELAETYLSKSKDDLGKFDKNFFWGVTGTFGFTITFIKDIVNIANAYWLPCLLLSWCFMVLSIIIIALSFYLTAFNNYLSAETNFYNNKMDYEPQKNKHDDKVNKRELDHLLKWGGRFWSIVLFCIGLFFLFIFLSINFLKANKFQTKSAKDTIDKIVESPKASVNPNKNDSNFKSESINTNTSNHTDTQNNNSITLEKKIDSMIILIRLDTFRQVASACSCPPESNTCSLKCKMKRRQK
jgi:amino acid transporter